MKLSDLNPAIETYKVLVLDCPCGGKHKLRLPLGPGRHEWTAIGDLANLSLKPTIMCDCWEGLITDGKVITCPKDR
jgi:Family of unknown function (DUF6527)